MISDALHAITQPLQLLTLPLCKVGVWHPFLRGIPPVIGRILINYKFENLM